LWWKWGWLSPEVHVFDLRSIVVNKLPWRWHLGDQTCRSWYLMWSVFYDLFYRILFSEFCWLKYENNEYTLMWFFQILESQSEHNVRFIYKTNIIISHLKNLLKLSPLPAGSDYQRNLQWHNSSEHWRYSN
jgi:hypothetical protein